ncbi:MAG TPA: DUF1573 domain-containing protein [Thermoanaerobaculia bacterium]|nr:DUF1573 domain-containing protein [Thermoanaerobaculia bacterium]
MSKRILVTFLALTIALTISSLAVAQEKPAKAPQLTIVEPLKDFGTVPKGDKLDFSFQIKNSGTADLQILSAQPACGCTVADFDKVIKPGETGKVTAHLDTTSFAGPISKGITLQTNDPNTPTAQLTINAIVKPYVEAHPAGFVRFNMLQGDVQTQSLVLYTHEEEPFAIQNVEVPGDFVKVAHRKIEKPEELVKAGLAGQSQYRIDVTFGGPTAQIGPIAEKVKIHTNSKHSPQYSVSISGVVRPTYTVMPTVLNFGEVSAGDASASRNIILRSNDQTAPQMFQVTKVESSTPAVSAQVLPNEKPGEFQVTAKLAKGAKAGAIEGNLKIYTSDTLNPVFTLPLKGNVKAEAKPVSK